jgi:hypothetical protein
MFFKMMCFHYQEFKKKNFQGAPPPLDFQRVHLLLLVLKLHFKQHASLSLLSYMFESIWFSLTLKSPKYPKDCHSYIFYIRYRLDVSSVFKSFF